MSKNIVNFEKKYSEESFWKKFLNHALSLSKDFLEKILYLYYAAKEPDTPTWAKGVIYGALGYFISPIDAIPDAIPGIGYADDISVIAAAIATVALYITPKVKEKAKQKIEEWFV
ncbi:MAG: DUF1232 domain-containing protein [Desulfobacterales bacterium]|nr:DUF1232 domain-containing protein [Desulfobacterales bacterium]